MYIARAFAKQSQFFDAVAKVASGLPPAIVSVTPSLGTDYDGEPAVFFRVILADATPRNELLSLTEQTKFDIILQVEPLEEWGVLPYFDFLTQSEDARVNLPAPA
jgi:hypothetical protein